MKRVAFVDESGTKSFCNCVVVAGLVVEAAGSYVYWGVGLVDEIRRSLGIVGELKWRRVKRRGGRELVEALLRRFEVRHFAVHYTSQRDFETHLWRFLTDIDADIFVLDTGLADASKFPRAVSKPSHKVPGLQLADLVAGLISERYRGGGCRGRSTLP
ncbi:MAG: DUF3800 domain-containing protein [Thermoproteus sp.]